MRPDRPRSHAAPYVASQRPSVIDDRLIELGITLPPVFPPAGNYLACVVDADLVYVGGHGPVDGTRFITGKVGSDVSLDQARDARA